MKLGDQHYGWYTAHFLPPPRRDHDHIVISLPGAIYHLEVTYLRSEEDLMGESSSVNGRDGIGWNKFKLLNGVVSGACSLLRTSQFYTPKRGYAHRQPLFS